MKNMEFYKKLDVPTQKHYDLQEQETPHTDKFKELMNRTERVNGSFHFTDEEMEYLGKEDIATFMDLFPSEAEYYMSW